VPRAGRACEPSRHRAAGGARRASRAASARTVHYLEHEPMNENFSLVVMCIFLLASLAFLAEQLTSYH
jgi:hypothetical protein